MYYHIILQKKEKYYELSKEKVKRKIELFNLNFSNCKIYSSEKKLEEIASIFEQRKIKGEGYTIHGLYTRENALELDAGREFIKDCTSDFFIK